MEEKCLKTLPEYRERRCRCHVWWKTIWSRRWRQKPEKPICRR